MTARTLLDEVELPQAQCVAEDDAHVLAQHAVPALEGDFLQRLERRASRVSVAGVLTGEGAREGLGRLRKQLRAAAPVDFVADITTATRVGRVLIEALEVRELAGKPERWEYALTLREYQAAPAQTTEEPPEPPAQPEEPQSAPDVTTGTLLVEVVMEGDPGWNPAEATVTTTGLKGPDAGTERTLADRAGNVWTAAGLHAGEFRARAAVGSAGERSSFATATVEAGKTVRVLLTLPAQPAAAVAKAFVVHFRIDNAFVEPCMREVLRRAVAFGNTDGEGKGDRLLIVGHTDRTDVQGYNQPLSERRARAVHAFLTFGRDPEGAVAEWDALRREPKPGKKRLVEDGWGAREYQWMLQDLGFYPGRIDGDHGPMTDDAVRAFRCARGLPPGTKVDDAVWDALIRAYLGQDGFKVPAERFFANCGTEPLKWLGCGELDPTDPPGVATEQAHRPYRRVELLFIRGAALPCKVPEPVTFRSPKADSVGSNWCLGPGDAANPCCFLTRVAPSPPKLLVQPAEPGTVDVAGTLVREVEKPDGTLDSVPVPDRKVVLITADGHYKDGELASGEPKPAKTDKEGKFAFPGQPVGVYTLEVLPGPDGKPVLARVDGQEGPVEGAVVCKRLTPTDGALDVIIVRDPPLREIRLPVAVHLMTALDPATRLARPFVDNAFTFHSQRSTLTADDVRNLFRVVNRIWGQARVRFEVVDVVREAYAFRTDGPLDEQEFTVALLDRCAYPGAVNVFLVADVRTDTSPGEAEAGIATSPEDRVKAGDLPDSLGGIALGERSEVQGIKRDVTGLVRVQALAHELGHYLALPHLTPAEEGPATALRLMRPGTLTGLNRQLIVKEIDTARKSRGAAADCVPLRLKVTGAVVIGGSLNNRFLAVVDPASPPTVTVDAEIPGAMLDPRRGTLVMAGGAPGANDRQRTVATAAAGPPVEVTATYTPAGGGTPTVRRVFIHVVTFALRIVSPTPLPAGNLFRRTVPATPIVIEAALAPPLFCAPEALVAWENGLSAHDPLRRRVQRTKVDRTTVKATVAGITRELTVTVFDVALVDDKAPFTLRQSQAMVGGVLNSERGAFDPATLIAERAEALFRLRVHLPGFQGATFPVRLASDVAGEPPLDLVLPKTADEGVYLSAQSILAIPRALPRNQVKLKDPGKAQVIRARAEGRLTLTPGGPLAATDPVVVPVAGRVVSLCIITVKGSKPDPKRDLDSSSRSWAQVGLEVRVVGPGTVIDDPTLHHLETREDNAKLFALGREECTSPTKLRGYYTRTNKDGDMGIGGGNRFVVFDVADRTTFAHELGHCLDLQHSAEKTTPNPTQAQKDNLMFWRANSLSEDDALLTDAQFLKMTASKHVQVLG